MKKRSSSIWKQLQGIEEILEHSQGTTPSYTFSNGKPDYGDIFDAQEGFFHGLTTSVSKGFNGVNSGWSSAFSDLISDLYSQAEQISTVNSTRQPTANEFSSTQLGLNSDLVNGDDDLDENDWEFKDAFSEGTVGNPEFDIVDAHQNFSAELKLKNFVGFYSRLKDEARFFILDHLDDLKTQEVTVKLEKKLEDLHFSDKHAIIPNHLHVPEAERSGLSFGSFDASFGLNAIFKNGPNTDKSFTTLSESS